MENLGAMQYIQEGFALMSHLIAKLQGAVPVGWGRQQDPHLGNTHMPEVKKKILYCPDCKQDKIHSYTWDFPLEKAEWTSRWLETWRAVNDSGEDS